MGLSFLNFFIVIISARKMFSWNNKTEEIIDQYTHVSGSKEDFEELELEKLKLRLLLKTIESSRTLMETEERGKQAKQKLYELCYAFSFASLKDRKKRMRKKIEKTQQLLTKLNTVATKGEFHRELVEKTKERISQYRKIESKPTIKRRIVEQVLITQIDNKISQTKKYIIKRAITAPLKPGKEVRVLLDKKHLTIINEKTKMQYETGSAMKEIEDIFKIKSLFGVSLKTIDSPLIIDIRKQENKIKMDITEKIFEGNHIKTKNHSISLEA